MCLHSLLDQKRNETTVPVCKNKIPKILKNFTENGIVLENNRDGDIGVEIIIKNNDVYVLSGSRLIDNSISTNEDASNLAYLATVNHYLSPDNPEEGPYYNMILEEIKSRLN